MFLRVEDLGVLGVFEVLRDVALGVPRVVSLDVPGKVSIWVPSKVVF